MDTNQNSFFTNTGAAKITIRHLLKHTHTQTRTHTLTPTHMHTHTHAHTHIKNSTQTKIPMPESKCNITGSYNLSLVH